MMLHYNTLCISNLLLPQYEVSGDAVMQGRTEDFIPRSTKFAVAFEERELLGNKQDVEVDWVPRRVEV